jgi:hypothetical protein
VVCPARLTGSEPLSFGVVLDFEDVRVALGLERVSVDLGPLDYEAIGEYHRLNNANREFVKDTRSTERSNPEEAVARYREALATLTRCRNLARDKGLSGFEPNQTDSIPLERLVLCLMKSGKRDEAEAALKVFIEDFPHARDTRVVSEARKRIERARR